MHYNGVCYKRLTGSLSATSGGTSCQGQGGELGSFHSLDEWQDFAVHKWVEDEAAGTPYAAVWIGLTDVTTELQWRWFVREQVLDALELDTWDFIS